MPHEDRGPVCAPPRAGRLSAARRARVIVRGAAAAVNNPARPRSPTAVPPLTAFRHRRGASHSRPSTSSCREDHRRQVPRPRGARRGGHGDGLRGAPRAAREPRRHQGAATQPLQKRDAVQPVSPRSARRGAHRPSEHLRGLRLGTLDDGRPYLVMDACRRHAGRSDRSEQGGLPFQEVVDTVTQVLSGLARRAREGILHRDVKPENVFLSERVGCTALGEAPRLRRVEGDRAACRGSAGSATSI